MPTVFVVGARGIPDVEGGAEKNAERLFPLVVKAGWRVVVVGLSGLIRQREWRGIELRRAPRSRILKTDKLLYYVAAVFMALRVRPDIVHLQGLGSAIMLWAYRLLGMRTVVRYGSVDYLHTKWGLLARLGFRFSEAQLRFADGIIAVTPSLAQRLRSRGLDKTVHVIPNALDSRADYNVEDDLPHDTGEPFVLAVGRVTAEKNLHSLIRGFHKFSASHPRFRLLIAGGLDDQEYLDELRPLLDDKVELLGRISRSQLGSYYRRATIYVNSSAYEGNSNAVLEAVSWSIPTLLSNIPGNRDFGLPDRHYFDANSPDAIAAALARAAADPQTYVPDADRFMTWDQVAAATLKIYENVLTDAAPSRASLRRPTSNRETAGSH